MNIPLIILIGIVRIAEYFFIYIAPFPGLLLSMFLDFIDGGVIYFARGTPEVYRLFDKPLDVLLYFMLIPLAWKTPVRKAYLAALAFRLTGQTIAWVTGNQLTYVFFPNFVEYTLLVYFGLAYLKARTFKNKFLLALQKLNWTDWRIWAVIFVFKLIQEIVLHSPGWDQRLFIGWEFFFPR